MSRGAWHHQGLRPYPPPLPPPSDRLLCRRCRHQVAEFLFDSYHELLEEQSEWDDDFVILWQGDGMNGALCVRPTIGWAAVPGGGGLDFEADACLRL